MEFRENTHQQALTTMKQKATSLLAIVINSTLWMALLMIILSPCKSTRTGRRNIILGRRSNIILLALWWGIKKPSRSVFVDPCVSELKKLSSTGIQYDGVTYKIRPVIVTVETIARPVLRNTMQFNGKFGCDFCLHPGIQKTLF
jgi:hypothetical protein